MHKTTLTLAAHLKVRQKDIAPQSHLLDPGTLHPIFIKPLFLFFLAETVTVDVVLPIPYSREQKDVKETETEPVVQTLEISYGIKVVDVLKHVCKECGLDDTAYVMTFGDSDRSVHPDLEIEAVNCTEFYLKNKMHLGKSFSQHCWALEVSLIVVELL